MKVDKRTDYITRDTIMKLLSDDDIARVSTAETAASLAEGDEYVDLEAPDRGVQRALKNAPVPMGRVLPRKAVRDEAWREIVILLSAHATERAETHPS
jgi:hypothetical protein